MSHKTNLQQSSPYRDKSNMAKVPRATEDAAVNKAKVTLGTTNKSINEDGDICTALVTPRGRTAQFW